MLKVGDAISVKNNLTHIYTRGTVTQVEICFFRVRDNWTGNVSTFHWNDNIEIEELEE